jgi:putative transposase
MPYQRPSPRRDHPAHRVIRLPNRPTIVFVTVCTKARQPVLASQTMHALLRDVWSSATAWFVGRYVIMPDHVHLFAAPGEPELSLTNWISFWKRTFTRRHGIPIWQDDYWDTTLRDQSHARERWSYVEQNPVRRGLVMTAEDWPWQGELNVLPWR